MQENLQNQDASTWLCKCQYMNQQDYLECEICGIPKPEEQENKQQQQSPPQSNEQPSPQIQPQDQRQSASLQPQGVAPFQNIYDYGPVQIVATVANTGDLVPKAAINHVIADNWKNKDAQLIIISQLGIINQGKSLYGNVLNHKLLQGRQFTPFRVGTTTKGMVMFSNPLPVKDDPNTQIVHLDVEGAYGLTNEPPEIQALGLKRLYVLSMLLSSVVIIHLGEKPTQSEISLLSEASETVLFFQSQLHLTLPKIYLLIKDAEDNEYYQASIEELKQRLKSQLKDEIFQNSEIMPRGKLSNEFLKSNPLDYSKVDQGYSAQMDKITEHLKDYKKKYPIRVNLPLKISDLPSLIERLGVGILNLKEYAPYLEQRFDYLRSEELHGASQKHLDLSIEECKAIVENPNNLALTTEQFTQQINTIQARHRTNFLQEVEAICQTKSDESPLLKSFITEFDLDLKISSFEQVFLEKKLAQESQQAEKEKCQKRQQELIQQQEALKQESTKLKQELQRKNQEHQQELDKWNAYHIQLINNYKAQHDQRIAQIQEQNKQRQQQIEAENAKARQKNQQKIDEHAGRMAQLNQQIAETQQNREEQKRKQEEERESLRQENEQKMEEKRAEADQKLAETQKNAEDQEQKRQEETQKQQAQEAQEKDQMHRNRGEEPVGTTTCSCSIF